MTATEPDPTDVTAPNALTNGSIGVVFSGSQAKPVFILAAPRSLSSVGCAMLAQHPELYGLPETHLFGSETMAGWRHNCYSESFRMADGLLRAVAEICYGGQTEATVKLAATWIQQRSQGTCGSVLDELARRVAPRELIEKSPSMVYSMEAMQRALRWFPKARFVHLVRHPRAYCASVLPYLYTLATPEYRQDVGHAREYETPLWLEDLASFPHSRPPTGTDGDVLAELDPQWGWYVLNTNAARFLECLPSDRRITVRSEDLVGDPMRTVTKLAVWLGVRADEEAVAKSMHPERSPFAHFGPPGARLGNDIFFLERPSLRPDKAKSVSLKGPLEWRRDGQGFLPEVIELAQRFGYR